MKKLFLATICFLLASSINGCSSTLKKYTKTATNLGFDTVFTFIAYTKNKAEFDTYYQLFSRECIRYSKLFDNYKSYQNLSNIKTINDQAGKKPVKVDPIIIDLLKLSKKYSLLTNSQFDITIGSVLKIWHTYRETGIKANSSKQESEIPPLESLKTAQTHGGWQHIQIDEAASTIYIDDPATSIDVGGSAKGYAVEKIAQKLTNSGCDHAIINGGGNIRIIGSKPSAAKWSVGVQIPDFQKLSSESLLSVEIDTSTSFVTSGDYQRFYMYKDQIMHHIIDPSTLYPARHARSVTIMCKDSAIADILSTSLYTMSHKDGAALLKQLSKSEGIKADAIWVYDKQRLKEDQTTSYAIKGYDVVLSEGLKDIVSK